MMVLRLLLYIVLLLVPFAGAGYLVYRGGRWLLRGSLRDQRKRLGTKNALMLKARMEEICAFCHQPTSPALDAYEAKTGWYHPICYKRLLND